MIEAPQRLQIRPAESPGPTASVTSVIPMAAPVSWKTKGYLLTIGYVQLKICPGAKVIKGSTGNAIGRGV